MLARMQSRHEFQYFINYLMSHQTPYIQNNSADQFQIIWIVPIFYDRFIFEFFGFRVPHSRQFFVAVSIYMLTSLYKVAPRQHFDLHENTITNKMDTNALAGDKSNYFVSEKYIRIMLTNDVHERVEKFVFTSHNFLVTRIFQQIQLISVGINDNHT